MSHRPLLMRYASRALRTLSRLDLIMHLSMLSLMVVRGEGGGGTTHGTLIQRAFPWVGILTLSRCSGEFDLAAICGGSLNIS